MAGNTSSPLLQTWICCDAQDGSAAKQCLVVSDLVSQVRPFVDGCTNDLQRSMKFRTARSPKSSAAGEMGCRSIDYTWP